jgi:hypothetical protein
MAESKNSAKVETQPTIRLCSQSTNRSEKRMTERRIELTEIRRFIDDFHAHLDKTESPDKQRLISILYMITHELEDIHTKLINPKKT